MKRIGNLYECIISVENLLLADEKARRGKKSTYGVLKHDRNRDENILNLHEALKNKTFQTSEYHVFTIREPKEREIHQLPYYPDRIVHHAIMNVMEPIWVSIFTKDTYSCIKGRGIHAAAERLKRQLKNDVENTAYCLKIDVRKFYPSVDHDILKSIIRRKIKDADLLWLLDSIIDSAPGVPIGNYLSQFFANLYLSYFDHYVKEVLKVKYYYRYADDMVFLSPSKADLHALLIEINHYLHENLRLDLKGNYQVFPTAKRGIDFVGYRFFHTHTLMRKSIKKNFCREAATANKLDLPEKQHKLALCPWIGWARHCDSKHLLKTILLPK
jgi:retron-type reverse transcriptase